MLLLRIYFVFRRVCGDWNLTILWKLAPFLRNVVLSTGFFRSTKFQKVVSGLRLFWSYAWNATTLIMCGKGEEGARYGFEDLESPLVKLWDSCRDAISSYSSSPQINKVTYAYMAVHSCVFRYPAVLRVGFQTVLYHSTLILMTGTIAQFYIGDEDDVKDGYFLDFDIKLMLRVRGHDSYSLNEVEVEQMKGQWFPKFITENSSNPVAEHFARNNCTHLEDSQLAFLTDGNSLRKLDTVVRDSAAAIRNLVKQLINRYI